MWRYNTEAGDNWYSQENTTWSTSTISKLEDNDLYYLTYNVITSIENKNGLIITLTYRSNVELYIGGKELYKDTGSDSNSLTTLKFIIPISKLEGSSIVALKVNKNGNRISEDIKLSLYSLYGDSIIIFIYR